jgi:hypothetical protein
MAYPLSPSSQQIAVYNALIPPEGPKIVNIPLDFTTTGSNGQPIGVDFTVATLRGAMTVVQTLWADNTANSAPLVVNVSGTGQQITIPPGIEGTFPIFAASKPTLTFNTSTSIIIPCIIANMPMPVGTWGTAGGGGPQSVVVVNTPLDVQGAGGAPLEVKLNAGSVSAIAGAAFSVVTGGTAVAAFTPSMLLLGGVITNPQNATESLFVDAVNTPGTVAPGANGTTTELLAGQSFRVPGGLSGAVQVNAVTSGHAFTAWGA